MVAGALAAPFVWSRVQAQAHDASLALVMAVDVSASIDTDHFWLQRKGYIEALTNPDVLRAVADTETRRIALTYFEWAGHDQQRLLLPWQLFSTLDDGEQIAALLNEVPRPFEGVTGLGAAIGFAHTLLSACPYRTQARVIDVSGDGDSNDGTPAGLARDAAVADGVTINGLAIDWARSHPPIGMTIEEYYRREVQGGTRAFVMRADGFDTFGYALAAKLRMEVAGRHGRRSYG